jgi:hypothetical protein
MVILLLNGLHHLEGVERALGTFELQALTEFHKDLGLRVAQNGVHSDDLELALVELRRQYLLHLGAHMSDEGMQYLLGPREEQQ